MLKDVPDEASAGGTASAGSLAPAVTRALAILDLLAAQPREPMSLADLSRGIKAAKSSTSNICSVLEERGMIRREATGYVLGRRNLELGGAYLSAYDQIRDFYRLCAQRPELSSELVQIAVLADRDVIFLARHEGRTPLRLSGGATVGDRFPAALTAVGNALISALPSDEVTRRFEGADYSALTPRSVRSFAQLQERIAVARERGYAVDEGGVFPNVVGLAVVVPPRQSGDNTLAVNISRVVPTDPAQWPDEAREHIAQVLRDLAAELANPMAFGGEPA